MRSVRLRKILSTIMIGVGILVSIPTTQANAEWKQDNNGWWYTEGNSWATGWRQINGKWYYFGQDGYMWQNRRTPDGYWVFLNGERKEETINPNTPVSQKSNKEFFTVRYDPETLEIKGIMAGKQTGRFVAGGVEYPNYLFFEASNYGYEIGNDFVENMDIRKCHLENNNGTIIFTIDK